MTLHDLTTVDEHWREFEARLIPPEAGEAQREDMRRAFYSGALAMLSLQSNNLSGGEFPETDNDRMGGWLAEVQQIVYGESSQ